MEQPKLIRYRRGSTEDYGLIADGMVYRLGSALWAEPQLGPLVAPLKDVELLAPCQPTKIVAIGRNYAAHAAEHGAEVPAEPLVFLKPPSSINHPGSAIIYPDHLSSHVEYEAELVAVIGRRASRVPAHQAYDYVWGYTCGNDVTARDLQRRDSQWARAKGFDTFCPVGPWIVPGLDITNLRVRCLVNGQVRQDGQTKDMVFPLPELISYITAFMTLEPGDLILTGTPEGVGPLQPGDRVTVEIEGIGALHNQVSLRA
jgi:2-keto-4-pentenoate hydratase/2-oxohepta-3-ene-1,7-dioic acid hydratase in catechol pathway